MRSHCRVAVLWARMPAHHRVGLVALLLLILPMGAVTSMGRYAMRDALDHLTHRPFDAVAVREGGVFSPAALVFHAQRQTGGRAVRLELPARRDRAVRVMIAMPYGEMVVAYIDPYTADLRGTLRYAGAVAMVDRWLVGDADLTTAETAKDSEDLCSAGDPDSTAPDGALLTLDEAIDRFDRAGLSPPYTIDLPRGPGGYYLARTHPGVGQTARIINLDARDGLGRPLG